MQHVAAGHSPVNADQNGTGAQVAPCFSVGIDLGGTNLRVAAYSGDADRLHAVSLQTRLSHGPAAVLRDIADAVLAVHANCANFGHFRGVGIGSPGPIDLPEGRLIAPANLPGWHNLSLKQELEKLLNLRVIVESDANAAALAEWHRGSGKAYGVDSMAMVTMGTGVGGGVILRGRIWHGGMGMAAEPGHCVVQPGGLQCNCGSSGCLEMYASATAVRRAATAAARLPGGEKLRRLQDGDNQVHAHSAAELARDGDAAAARLFQDAGNALGRGLAQMIGCLNLSLYTVGGGMSKAWDLFAPAMFDALHQDSQVYRMTLPDDRSHFQSRRTNICPAHLGPDAGLLGAALLPHFE